MGQGRGEAGRARTRTGPEGGATGALRHLVINIYPNNFKMVPKKDTKKEASIETDKPVDSSLLDDIVERSMRRVMESLNTTIRTEVNILRKEIDELRRSLELIVVTAVANVRKMVEDRVSPVESKVRDLEESIAILRDQVSANQDAIKSISLS